MRSFYNNLISNVTVFIDKGIVIISNNRIKIETAATFEQQTKGLSNRTSLPINAGMLFIYPDYQLRSFWMKEMKFSIDIIWIANKKVVGIEKNVPLPQTVPIPTYRSPQPVNYALEVNAGYADKHNVKPGDLVIFNI